MRIGLRFAWVETRRTVRKMLAGMVSELPNKNCWTLAEHAGDTTPDAMQHLLAEAVDDDGMRDDLRDYVVEHLGDAEATLVVDETGDLKKGVMTVGVQRQYSGTTGRIENCQVAVYLTYATTAGHGSSTVPCICRARGAVIPSAAPRPGCPPRPGSPPNPCWPNA